MVNVLLEKFREYDNILWMDKSKLTLHSRQTNIHRPLKYPWDIVRFKGHVCNALKAAVQRKESFVLLPSLESRESLPSYSFVLEVR